MEATVTEGLLPPVEMPDDHDKDFSTEVLKEAQLLGLNKSAFLAAVFDEPNVIAEGVPPFTNAVHPSTVKPWMMQLM
jgi:hypothetical protein